MARPQRILEVTINSAHGLPQMSKLLRTFVAAWVNPETKLSTKVDLHGHTNPKWNCKLVFRVDDHFLLTDSSVVIMEIYNVAWLRDLPMGRTRLMIGKLLRNHTQKNQSMQNISLPIRRASSGQPQGTLNVSVNVVGGYPTPTPPPKIESTVPSSTSRTAPKKENKQTLHEKFEARKMERKSNPRIEKMIQHNKTSKIIFSRSNSIKNKDKDTADVEISSITDNPMWIHKSESDTKSTLSSNASLFFAMNPLPSETTLDFNNKGCNYQQSPGSCKMNNIFENWSDSSSTLPSKSAKRGVDARLINLLEKDYNGGGKNITKNKSANQGGIMSCFGNAFGFQCKVSFGSKDKKKRRKKNKHESLSPVFTTSDEQNLRRLYF